MRNPSALKSMGLLLALAITAACGGERGEQAAAPPVTSEPAAPAAPAAPPAEAPSGALPAGVTAAMVEQGQQVFNGPGVCFTCHGQQGQGTPLGPALNDNQWLWIENPQQDLQQKLVTVIRDGVARPKEYPAPMPPMGGASLNDEQLQSVAAYVASLNS